MSEEGKKRTLTIGTRGSALALWQAHYIDGLLADALIPSKIKVIKTRGDIILDTPLNRIGGKGLFTKELESELASGEIDIAVHSLKDVPVDLDPMFTLCAITKREDLRDCLVSYKYTSLLDLPHGAKVGTTSLRRAMQVIAIRGDLDPISLRGNVQTRLKKLESGEFDAIILANAGINRLGLREENKELTFSVFSPKEMIPAMGQGALGIEVRSSDEALAKRLFTLLNDAASAFTCSLEREFVALLNGGCQVPIGINARQLDASIDASEYNKSLAYKLGCEVDNLVEIRAIIGTVDNKSVLREHEVVKDSHAFDMIEVLARRMRENGADRIIEQSKEWLWSSTER